MIITYFQPFFYVPSSAGNGSIANHRCLGGKGKVLLASTLHDFMFLNRGFESRENCLIYKLAKNNKQIVPSAWGPFALRVTEFQCVPERQQQQIEPL